MGWRWPGSGDALGCILTCFVIVVAHLHPRFAHKCRDLSPP